MSKAACESPGCSLEVEDEVVGAGTRGGGVAAVAAVLPTEADPEDGPLLAPVTAACFELVITLHRCNHYIILAIIIIIFF